MALSQVKAGITAACARSGRAPDGITLVAVSKEQPAEKILPLLNAGLRDFGESRVQEAATKWPALKEQFPDLRLHLIGHLQTNKAAQAVSLFDVIHTVDSARLCAALSAEMTAQNKRLPCFLQVNTGEEPQKGGVAPRDLPALHAEATRAGLPVAGLMCIPPLDDIAALHFALLSKLARTANLPGLSMGMSADYETAVRLGATHLRIGTALFAD